MTSPKATTINIASNNQDALKCLIIFTRKEIPKRDFCERRGTELPPKALPAVDVGSSDDGELRSG
jgi:hypothetical protein